MLPTRIYPFKEVCNENDTATFNAPDKDGSKACPVMPNKEGASVSREVSNLTNQDAKAWTQTVQQMSQLTDPDSPDLHTLSENLWKESGLSLHAANYGDWSERAKLQTTPPKSLPQLTVTPSRRICESPYRFFLTVIATLLCCCRCVQR